MKNYYNLSTLLHDSILADPLVNRVTKGSLDKITNAKQDMYPLCHIIFNDVAFRGNTTVYNISLVMMSIVDVSKDDVVDIFKGNDNEDDVLNTTLSILNRIFERVRRGDISNLGYEVLDDTASCEPFVDRFTDAVAGWTMTFDILAPNEMTIC
jgi:hypothetical protein